MTNFVGHCFLQWFLIKIVTAQMPAAKYIMGNMAPVRSNMPSLPSVPMPYPNPAISSLLNYLPNYPNLPVVPNLSNVVPNLQNTVPNLSNVVPNLSNTVPNLSNVVPTLSNVPNLPFSNIPSCCPQQNPRFPLPTSNMNLPMPQGNLFDPTAMNNLAVALHLLILANLLHSESEDHKPNPPATETAQPYPQNPQPYPQNPQPYPQNPAGEGSPVNSALYSKQPIVTYLSEPPNHPEPQPLTPPNSKFLSSSGFVEPPMSSMIGAPMPYGNQNQNPRNNYSLMSPYEALGPGPQGKDVFAQYGPQNLKADFQSPYNSIMAHDNTNKDLFNMF